MRASCSSLARIQVAARSAPSARSSRESNAATDWPRVASSSEWRCGEVVTLLGAVSISSFKARIGEVRLGQAALLRAQPVADRELALREVVRRLVVRCRRVLLAPLDELGGRQQVGEPVVASLPRLHDRAEEQLGQRHLVDDHGRFLGQRADRHVAEGERSGGDGGDERPPGARADTRPAPRAGVPSRMINLHEVLPSAIATDGVSIGDPSPQKCGFGPPSSLGKAESGRGVRHCRTGARSRSQPDAW